VRRWVGGCVGSKEEDGRKKKREHGLVKSKP
jgi:hypothetical protein